MKSLKAWCCILLATALGACSTPTDAPSYTGFRPLGDENLMMDSSQWGELNSHDPAIFKDDDGTYYVFSTDASYGDMHKTGVQVRKSADLITWQYVGTAFDDFEKECAEVIAHAKLDPAKNQGLWAPDVIKVGNTYRMYFSASTFGESRSCIGLAESKKAAGPYTYKGIVVKSETGAVNGPNDIDPALIYDADGNLYMAYGSFFGGIFMVQLDNETGFVKDGAEKPVRIAGSRGASIEGSYIVFIPEGGYYYLFVSYGSLSSDYNIRVGRSRSVTGPYIDANGKDMASLGLGNHEKVGTKLMGGYTFLSNPGVPPSKGYMAPGHNSALIDGNDYFLVHHVRTYTLSGYWFSMNVRRFCLNSFDWPVVAPNRYYGETLQAAELPDGVYAFVKHLNDSNADSRNSVMIDMVNGVISGAESGSYRIYNDYHIELTIDGVLYDGVVLKQYDWERIADVTAFTAMSEDGLCVWGVTQL